jgi:hypothetical protein
MGRGFHLAELRGAGELGNAEQAVGQAVQNAGDAVFRVQEEVRRAREASQLSDVLGQASVELGQKTLDYQRDQDFKSSPQRFQGEAGEIGKRYAGQFNNDIQREAFKREYGRLATAHHLNILTSAARQEGDANVAQLDSNLDVYAKSAANAQNPLERDVVVNQARLAIAEQRRAGWITDVDAEKRRKVFESKLEHATVMRDIDTDATGTLKKLTSDPAYATAVDPLTKQTLIHSAQVREVQNRSRALPGEAREDAEKSMTVPSPTGDEAKFQPISTAGGVTAHGDFKKAVDVRANLGKWISNAEAEAERRHPGDAVYRDMVVNRVKSYVGTIVAAQEGEERQAYTSLVGTVHGLDGGKKPLSQDELFARPGARDSFAKLDEVKQTAVLRFLDHNLNESLGKPAVVNARLVNQIFPRLFLDVNDPRAIYKPEQLAQFVSQGLTPEGHTVLERKLIEIQHGGKGSAAMIERVNNNARAQLLKSTAGQIEGEKAEFGALLFRAELEKQIEEYRKAGKDIGPLITPDPTSKEYFGRPANVMRFMSATPQETVASQAAAVKAKESPPPVAEMPKLDARDPEKSFNSLPAGSWFVAPDGRVGRKPGAAAPTTAPAPAVPKAPAYEQFVEKIGPKSQSVRINAPGKSPARALSGQTFESREAALEALRKIYEGGQ